MKCVRAAVLASAVLLASTAAQADGMRRGSLKDAAAPFSWTGLYVGVNAGYAWANDDVALNGLGGAAWNPYYPDPFRKRDLDGSGFSGGAQIGYNYQLNTLVIGIEADISKTDLDRSLTTNGPGPGDPYNLHLRQELDWLATVRGRLGFTPTHRSLVYVTGGWAIGRVSATSNLDFAVTHYDVSGSDTRVGWTIGGGIEHSFASNWSLKAEYLYYDLGSVSLTANPSPPNPPFQTRSDFDERGQIVRAGLNYKFN